MILKSIFFFIYICTIFYVLPYLSIFKICDSGLMVSMEMFIPWRQNCTNHTRMKWTKSPTGETTLTELTVQDLMEMLIPCVQTVSLHMNVLRCFIRKIMQQISVDLYFSRITLVELIHFQGFRKSLLKAMTLIESNGVKVLLQYKPCTHAKSLKNYSESNI